MYKTALIVLGWTEMNATVTPSQYYYDIIVECQNAIVNPGNYVSANITITNKGLFEGDIQLNFWLEDIHSTIYTSSSDVIGILQDQTWSSTKSLLVPSYVSAGIYYFKINVSTATYSSSAYCAFEVQVPVATSVSAGKGGGGGAYISIKPGEIPNIEVKYISNQIVTQNTTKEYDIEVKNSGNITLHNITLYLQGLELNWYSIYPNKIDLGINETAIFKIIYTIPPSAEIKKYPVTISIKSDELEKNILIILNIIEIYKKDEFEKRREILEKEISEIEDEIKNLEERGIPAGTLDRLLYYAKGKLELAKIEMGNGNLVRASELLQEVKDLIELIKDMMPKTVLMQIVSMQREIILLVVVFVLIAIVLLILYFMSKRKKKKTKKRKFRRTKIKK
jgi:hypothetical protein